MWGQGQGVFEKAFGQTGLTLFEIDETDRLVGFRQGWVRDDGSKKVRKGLRSIPRFVALP